MEKQVIASTPGVGLTEELSFRVSTAVLVRAILKEPITNREMLVLERKVTAELNDDKSVKCGLSIQPIGGASRILQPTRLSEIAPFNYDSDGSRDQQDLRIQIRPADWDRVKNFCVQNFKNSQTQAIEADPRREFAEELKDALGIDVSINDYTTRHIGVVIPPVMASNRPDARGQQTARVFSVFHAEITNPDLIQAILNNSNSIDNEKLTKLASDKARLSEKRAKKTALAVFPLEEIVNIQASRTQENFWDRITIKGVKLADNVPVLLCSEYSALLE